MLPEEPGLPLPDLPLALLTEVPGSRILGSPQAKNHGAFAMFVASYRQRIHRGKGGETNG